MKFTKMHGIGNDYIYINLFDEKVDNPEELSRRLSDRHFGVGSDGLVLIGPSETGDFSMRMFNVDGSEAQMCGNAARCVGKFVYDKGLTTKKEIALETRSGIKMVELTVNPDTDKVESVRINMGPAILSAEAIPVQFPLSEIIDYPLSIDGSEYRITCVSMGNPHAVVFTTNIDALNIEDIGPKIETHPAFPERTNVEFIEIIDRHTLKMRVWERGSGETLACGTGACASVVAGVLNGLCEPQATVLLKGGNLEIEWNRAENNVYLTGAAEFVFEGSV
ncbi:diaminopimelate epimerase [Petrimonas sp.]|uniref:diaminopimelate epimerase n=1 Tax=Petrimonas sp. TaxID=2023866 RepID=UPI003F5134A8